MKHLAMFGLRFFSLPLQNSRNHERRVHAAMGEGMKAAGVIANSNTKGMMAQTSMKISHSGHFTVFHSPRQRLLR